MADETNTTELSSMTAITTVKNKIKPEKPERQAFAPSPISVIAGLVIAIIIASGISTTRAVGGLFGSSGGGDQQSIEELQRLLLGSGKRR